MIGGLYSDGDGAQPFLISRHDIKTADPAATLFILGGSSLTRLPPPLVVETAFAVRRRLWACALIIVSTFRVHLISLLPHHLIGFGSGHLGIGVRQSDSGAQWSSRISTQDSWRKNQLRPSSSLPLHPHPPPTLIEVTVRYHVGDRIGRRRLLISD